MSASERAYQHVKERVLDGTLPGGELISEDEIAEALGMSRTPVRAAFGQLEAEGCCGSIRSAAPRRARSPRRRPRR